MTVAAKDVIFDLLLAADGEDGRESYAHHGVVENGPDQAMAVLVNTATNDRFRITVFRVT